MPTPIAARVWRCQVAVLVALFSLCARPPAAAAESAAIRQASQTPSAAASQIQAERYTIEVLFQPERSYLHATAAITFRAGSEVKYVELQLNRHLDIKSVMDSSDSPLEWTRSDRILSSMLAVRLAAPVPAGQRFVLTFVYEGELPRGQLDYITKDGILLRDESRWYPAADFSAFTMNDMEISLPAGWQGISSGALQSTSSSAQSVSWRWQTSHPVSSRSIVAVPFTSHDSQVLTPAGTGGTSFGVGLVVAPEDARRSEILRERITRQLTELKKLLGNVPEDYFTVVEGFPGARDAFGYSAPGFLVASPPVFQYADVPAYSPEFLPHEIAHQWFPIGVTIAKEEDGWLAESIAEYLAWRCLLANDPEAARQLVATALRDSLEPEPLRPLALGLKLFALEPWSVTRATLYERGMLVFRTLETVIDRERVDRTLAEYYLLYRGQSASIANFRKICEEIAGRDLGWFFEYFLNGTEIPEIELRETPSGSSNVAAGEIAVKNMPPEATLRVEMRVRTARGFVDHSVATRGQVTPFTVNVPAPSLGISLDPDARILRWTEAARRNRAQIKLLEQVARLESARKLLEADRVCRQALAIDPQDAALNEQRIHFTRGRLLLQRKGAHTRASREFQAALDGHSIDTMETNVFRAWVRVYRAKMAKAAGNLAVARREAKAGLTLLAPALDQRVAWTDSHRLETPARKALTELAD